MGYAVFETYEVLLLWTPKRPGILIRASEVFGFCGVAAWLKERLHQKNLQYQEAVLDYLEKEYLIFAPSRAVYHNTVIDVPALLDVTHAPTRISNTYDVRDMATYILEDLEPYTGYIYYRSNPIASIKLNYEVREVS